jgi:hypothetical protein
MEFILALSIETLKDIDKGRLAENLIFLIVLWSRVKPHLKKIEERMAGMEQVMGAFKVTVDKSLQSGELRFSKIESRLDFMESSGDDESPNNKENPQEGNHGKTI